jgi:hypothetical protein
MVAKALLTSISLAISIAGAAAGLKSSGVNSSTIVTWDKYSLKIDGAREVKVLTISHFHNSNVLNLLPTSTTVCLLQIFGVMYSKSSRLSATILPPYISFGDITLLVKESTTLKV